MITNNGKQLIGKFLLGQAPNFATHIAAGCGPTALLPDESLTEGEVAALRVKQALDFEMFRVPISAKGFIKEDGVEKIVFKAEMPTDQLYQITEVGFFPAAENSLAGSFDSKSLATFTPTESWVLYSSSASAISSASVASFFNSNGDILPLESAFFVNSSASAFFEQDRKERQETPRFYNKALLVSGDTSYIDSDFIIAPGSLAIVNDTLSFNFSQNLPPDQIKMAISVVSKETDNNQNPEKIRIVCSFVNNLPNISVALPDAKMFIEIDQAEFVNGADINRYKVITKTLSEFTLSDTFSWANINQIKINACAIKEQIIPVTSTVIDNGLITLTIQTENDMIDGQTFDVLGVGGNFNQNNVIFSSASSTTTSLSYFSTSASAAAYASGASGSVSYLGKTSDYKILFDGLRLDNVSSQNPLYTMVGYDIIRNDNAFPILKDENTNNYIEYRFGIGVT
jgi:hypothetical protein